ncbi:MAG: NUDIX domain-containing protein [Bacteroidetes bacterium]|jgi:8-oxo-dGTP pyrophosphatase MutT (NUDIX family)|nr:NUDIX domain-containing protein [Bacteroidota bacterium]
MQQGPIQEFNIRVYAIIENESGDVLISDEMFRKQQLIKFPGGGMKLGEGTLDCLKREALEEFGQEIEVIAHYYTTDYFIRTLFFEVKQLIAIYYRVKFSAPVQFQISTKPFDFEGDEDGTQSFRWMKKKPENIDQLTFEVDKKVMKMLIDEK